MRQQLNRLPYIVSYICAFALGMKQLREPDMWWQLLAGEWMLENGTITRTDEFSYTMEGTKWINVKWLYEVLIALIERGFGPHGVMLLQALVNVAIVYLLIRIAKYLTKHLSTQLSTLYTTIAIVLFLAISEFRMAGRPEMVSHLLTVVYLFILWRSSKFEWKQLLWLIPLQCLWANMHEGYPVGMVLIGIYILGSAICYFLSKEKEQLEKVKRLAIVWVGMAVAILLNPNTIKLWLQPFEIFRQLKANKYTTELLSFTDDAYWTIQAKVHIGMLVAVCLFWLYKIVLKRKEVQWSGLLISYLLSIPVFAYLSLSANRNIPFAQIMLFPSIPVMILEVVDMIKLRDKQFYKTLAQRTAIISAIIAAAFYVTIVSNKYYEYTESSNRYGIHISLMHNPIGAADFIRENNLHGPAFSDYFVSSYLLWDLYPGFKSYIDLRDLDIFSEDFFDEYMELNNTPSRFYELDSTYTFNYIVFSTSQLKPLQQLLYWREGFNVVYVGPVATILLRQSEENVELNSNMGLKLFSWPLEPDEPGWAVTLTKLMNPKVAYEEEDYVYAPIYAGRYYNMVGNFNVTKKQILPALRGDLSENGEAYALLGESYMNFANYIQDSTARAARLDSAMDFFVKAESLDPQNTTAQLGLANMSIMKNDYKAAKEHIENYLAVDEEDDFIYFLSGICSRNIWDATKDDIQLKEVISDMETSLELNENNVKAYLYLAEAHWHLGDKKKAREYMRETTGNIAWMPSEEQMLQEMRKLTGIKNFESSQDLIVPDTSTGEHEHAGHTH